MDKLISCNLRLFYECVVRNDNLIFKSSLKGHEVLFSSCRSISRQDILISSKNEFHSTLSGFFILNDAEKSVIVASDLSLNFSVDHSPLNILNIGVLRIESVGNLSVVRCDELSSFIKGIEIDNSEALCHSLRNECDRAEKTVKSDNYRFF